MFRQADPSLCEGAIIRTVPVHCALREALHAARWQRGLPLCQHQEGKPSLRRFHRLPTMTALRR